MRKIILLTLLFMVLVPVSLIHAQAKKPDWVLKLDNGTPPVDASKYYFGVGISAKSRREADAFARREFALNLSSTVNSKVVHSLTDDDGNESEQYDANTEILSKEELAGIAVNYRWYAEGTDYYSMIAYPKDEYSELIEKEYERQLERRRLKTKKAENENKLTKKEIQLEKENQRLKAERKRQRKLLYNKFLKLRQPSSSTTIKTGILNNKKEIHVAGGIVPFELRTVKLTWGGDLISLTEKLRFVENNEFRYNELSLGFQALPTKGEFYQTSIQLGVLYSIHLNLQELAFGEIIEALGGEKNENAIDHVVCPYIAATVTVPQAFYSYINVYSDFIKTSVSINSYPLYDFIGESVSTSVEFLKTYNTDYYNHRDESFFIQPAVNFHTSKLLTTSISFENNDTVMLKISYHK